ncbi:MAG: hypothetical protein KGL39_09880 [Patescibacteria group bacterium]|nr:hypothetical protein [Patescibacteria group bacterium]
MPRKPSIIPSAKLTLCLPEDIRTRLDIYLFSELEGRVPKGAYQAFFLSRILDFFESRRLPLEPFGFPQGFYTEGPKEMLHALETRLIHLEKENLPQ